MTIKLLKAYFYRGAKIHIRQIGDDIFEYLVVWRGNLYANYFNLTDKKKKRLGDSETGGAVLLVSSTAEGLVDELVQRHSAWYNLNRWMRDLIYGQRKQERITRAMEKEKLEKDSGLS